MSVISNHPFKCKAVSPRLEIPEAAIMQSKKFQKVDGKYRNLEVEQTEGSNAEALFVNSTRRIPADEEGNCTSIWNGPFWVRYDPVDPPVAEDHVGLVPGEWHLGKSCGGFIVIEVDTANERILSKPNLGGPFDAKLTSAVTVATNTLTGRTSFTFKMLVPDPAGAFGDLKEGATEYTGYNGSIDLKASSGTYIQVSPMANGEWRIVWVDCD